MDTFELSVSVSAPALSSEFLATRNIKKEGGTNCFFPSFHIYCILHVEMSKDWVENIIQADRSVYFFYLFFLVNNAKCGRFWNVLLIVINCSIENVLKLNPLTNFETSYFKIRI